MRLSDTQSLKHIHVGYRNNEIILYATQAGNICSIYFLIIDNQETMEDKK